jgi:hypothetical protein
MSMKKMTMLLLFASMLVPLTAEAQIRHIEMRVEGMT